LSVSLAPLAAGPSGGAWLVAATTLLPVARRVAPELRLPVRVAAGTRRRWFWFRDDSELLALQEIFREDEYALAGAGQAATIVDLGANCGQAALWLRIRFPDARILSVEPDPRTFAMLRRNVGRDPLITLRQVAITGADGWCRLEREPGASWGTRVSESADAHVDHVDHVPAVSLETLLDQHGIERVDLLKVDIEGMEHEALAASPALRRVRRVVGEIHASLLALPVEQALEEIQRNGGFDRSRLDGDIFLLERDPA
jgi:FkbM family methyltransferase